MGKWGQTRYFAAAWRSGAKIESDPIFPSTTEPAFAPGQPVHVRKVDAPGHIRTPHYIRGKTGFIERFVGHFRNPEELAYGRAGYPLRALYRVRFVQSHVWLDYAGPASDTIDIDLYEHWLQRTDTP